MRAKFVAPLGLLSLLCVALPGSVQASTYTYTGNAFTDCLNAGPDTIPPCTPTGYLSATISLSFTLPANMPFSDLTADLISATFTDNGQNGLAFTFPSATGEWTFKAGTGTGGQITSWTLEVANNLAELFTEHNDPQQGSGNPTAEDSSTLLLPPFDQQYQNQYDAYNVSAPGSWTCTTGCPTETSPVPEPRMFGPTLSALALLALMRKRIVPKFL
jgi:hypothetical protein